MADYKDQYEGTAFEYGRDWNAPRAVSELAWHAPYEYQGDEYVWYCPLDNRRVYGRYFNHVYDNKLSREEALERAVEWHEHYHHGIEREA